MAAIDDDEWPDIEAAVSGALTERGLGDVVRDVYEAGDDEYDDSAQRRSYAMLEAAQRFFQDRVVIAELLGSSLSELEGVEQLRFVDDEGREFAPEDEVEADRAAAEALQRILRELG